MNKNKLVGFIALFIILSGLLIFQQFFLPFREEKAAAVEKAATSEYVKELSRLEAGDIVELPGKQFKMVDYLVEGKYIFFKGLDGHRYEIEKLARSGKTRVIRKCLACEYCQIVQKLNYY